jgi:hypothetical protein
LGSTPASFCRPVGHTSFVLPARGPIVIGIRGKAKTLHARPPPPESSPPGRLDSPAHRLDLGRNRRAQPRAILHKLNRYAPLCYWGTVRAARLGMARRLTRTRGGIQRGPSVIDAPCVRGGQPFARANPHALPGVACSARLPGMSLSASRCSVRCRANPTALACVLRSARLRAWRSRYAPARLVMPVPARPHTQLRGWRQYCRMGG